MTRTTAMLILGAILLIVANLFGKDGTMARVAGMEKDELQASIDRAAPPPAGPAWASSRDTGESEPVQPVTLTDRDEMIEDLADEADDDEQDQAASQDDLADSSDTRPENADGNAFDPRVG